MVHLILVTLLASGSPSSEFDWHQIARGGYACQQTPPNASQECRDCMQSACEDYQSQIDGCGSNSTCKQTAKALYEVRLIACTGCNPSSLAGLRSLIRILPERERDWISLQTIEIIGASSIATTSALGES